MIGECGGFAISLCEMANDYRTEKERVREKRKGII